MTYHPRRTRIEFPELTHSLGVGAGATHYQPKIAAINAREIHRKGMARLRASLLSVETQHLNGELYADYLRARKTVFIDAKRWDLPQERGMEFDQYDTPQSRSVVVHEYGEILAGIRLLPTTARCGFYSYMLRDAQRGMIGGIPPYVLHEVAPVADHIWEASRLFVCPSVEADRRLLVQTRLMTAMAEVAVSEGATHVIGVVPAVFQRWMARLGMSALPLGPRLVIDGDKVQAAAMHVAALGQSGKCQVH